MSVLGNDVTLARRSCSGRSRNGSPVRARKVAGRFASVAGLLLLSLQCVDDAVAVLAAAKSVRVDIWLILPVVICLSQRLSHACLSTYFYTVKPRMAH